MCPIFTPRSFSEVGRSGALPKANNYVYFQS